MQSNDLNQIWNSIRAQVKTYESVDAAQVDAFFLRLELQAMSEGFAMLTADNDFIKNWIERHYIDYIKQALLDLYRVPFTVVVEIAPRQMTEAEPAKTEPPVQPSPGILPQDAVMQAPKVSDSPAPAVSTADRNMRVDEPSRPDLEWEEPYFPPVTKAMREEAARAQGVDIDGPTSTLTFENFVIGDSNRMAYSMAVAVAEMPGKAHLNPLFIYGKSGLGKTHLMRAIQNYIRETQPYLKTVYVDSAELLSDYTEASAAHDKEKSSYKNFKSRYEDADVLLIDDVQWLQGKKQTLDIVFQILNKLTDMGKQVVLSADRAPKNIDIDERYKTRFNSGGTFDIQPPEIETKLGIVKIYIDEYRESEGRRDFSMPNEIQTYIAESSSSNIRELKSAVTKVILHMTYFKQGNLELEDVRSILEDHFSGGPSKRLTVADIQKEVESFYKVSHAELVGPKRTRNIIYARQIAIYLCRQLLDLPFNDIGKKFNRDHSTVMYSVTNVEDKMKESRELREELETLKQIIREA